MLLKWWKNSEKMAPLREAVSHFLRKPSLRTTRAPHIRDATDIKRWMILVVLALLPCSFMAIWNSGVHSLVYQGNEDLLALYRESSSFILYKDLIQTLGVFSILKEGAYLFFPILFVSYAVGGFWEVLFATFRKTPIAEGFLVTGILYALILPCTLPLWMVALGVSLGIILGKEIFGGTGRNFLNPALICRCFLYFSFPAYLSGEVWVGRNSHQIQSHLSQINQSRQKTVDAYTQQSMLAVFSLDRDVKRMHIAAIESHLGATEKHHRIVGKHFAQYQASQPKNLTNKEKLKQYVTAKVEKGGLGLKADLWDAAFRYAQLKKGEGIYHPWGLFFGNRIGSMGETSLFACLLGALILLLTGIASYRTMLAFFLSFILTALSFEYGSHLGQQYGLLHSALFDFPFYKHLLMGSAVFGMIFMATDPVSSPKQPRAQIYYGALIGFIVMIIRILNPAYPEGVMLAILLGNIFAPLLDHFALMRYRKYYE